MYKDDFSEFKQNLASALAKKDSKDLNEYIFVYILYGTATNDKYLELAEGQQETIYKFLNIISVNFPDVVKNVLQEGLDKHFDLYMLCSSAVNDILEANDVCGEISVMKDLMLTALAATFRIVYENITCEDILAFMQDKECREMPSMKDSSITFAWAMENNIPCSDMRSLFDNPNQELTAEEEKNAYKSMGDMCKMFDMIVPVIVEDGVPQEFIDENLKTCRSVFMVTQMFYHMLPMTVDIDAVLKDSKKLRKGYDGFKEKLLGHEIREQMKGEDDHLYCIVFEYGLIVANEIAKRYPDDRQSLYSEVTKTMAESYEDDDE